MFLSVAVTLEALWIVVLTVIADPRKDRDQDQAGRFQGKRSDHVYNP